MKSIYLSAFALLISVACSGAYAGPKCTDEPQDKWLQSDMFKDKLVQDGYKIKKFKTTSGNCYEIYGWNKDGQKVEIYFNPVDASVVKQEIDD